MNKKQIVLAVYCVISKRLKSVAEGILLLFAFAGIGIILFFPFVGGWILLNIFHRIDIAVPFAWYSMLIWLGLAISHLILTVIYSSKRLYDDVRMEIGHDRQTHA